MEFRVVEEISSTNSVLYEEGIKGRKEDCLLLAFSQTNGKGRRGREFFSPVDTGLYMSIFLRRSIEVKEASKITPIMAVAAAEALENNGVSSVKIKWVNDLYLKERKVAGILTECSPLRDGKYTDFLVIGIGINIIEPAGGFPEDIKDKAGAVFDRNYYCKSSEDIKNLKLKIANSILDRFIFYYDRFPLELPVKQYKERSFLIGKNAQIVGGRDIFITGIDDDFGLMVKYDDGTLDVLTAGEVSLKI